MGRICASPRSRATNRRCATWRASHAWPSPENPYRYLEVRGRVERIDTDPDWGFINAIAKKYLGQERFPFGKPDDEWRIVVIRPERTTSMG
jgi:hypothetical protein